jgi:hypothetical protein
LFTEIEANADVLIFGPEGSIEFKITVGTKKKTVRLETHIVESNDKNSEYLKFEREVKDRIQLMENNMAKIVKILEG